MIDMTFIEALEIVTEAQTADAETEDRRGFVLDPQLPLSMSKEKLVEAWSTIRRNLGKPFIPF